MDDRPELKCRIVSSLEKVFCTEALDAPELKRIAGVRGETVNFQIAYRCDSVRVFIAACEVEAPASVEVRAFNERLVPCRLPANIDDPLVITTDPGMFPEPLTPIDPELSSVRGKWNALWVSVTPGKSCAAGTTDLTIRLRWKHHVPCSIQTPAPVYEEVLKLPFTVHDAELAPAKLICTQWFHADCLASYYRVEPWSEEHWRILENYMRDMTRHNINMLYTPLWSAPLDTRIGGERPTAQLLIIRKTADGKYEFDFSRLRRWFSLGLDCGFKYFEFAHAFTQWGARATPKVVAEVDGAEKRIFGWDVPADSPEYERFLAALTIDILGGKDSKRTWIHSGMAVLMAVTIIVFNALNNTSVIDAVYRLASYTYGPLLGLFTFGMIFKSTVKDRWVPVVAIVSPILCLVLDMNSVQWFNGYHFSYELLLMNAAFTIIGLLLISKKK